MPFQSRSDRILSDARLAPGDRIYAIGDLHGRLDLLRMLIRSIEADNAARVPAKVTIVILGDFIDRGPDSAAIVRILMAQRPRSVVVLAGNHERSLVDGLRGDRSAIELWIEHGGDATLRSYGASDDDIYPGDGRKLIGNVRQAIPRSVSAWMGRLPTYYRSGGYLFVHAGIRPGTPLKKQTADDLLWIRDDFTESDVDHGVIVVHGHTVTDHVCIRSNRIGVDTGAYRTGRLSAIGLEGNTQWSIDATAD